MNNKIKNKKSKLLILITLVIPIIITLMIILSSCGPAIKIEAQPSLITPPVDANNNLLVPVDENKIDFEKDDMKKVIEKAWNNMYYAPFLLTRQTGDVTTLAGGTKVVQSVSTYRMMVRSNEVGTADNNRKGLKQKINYLQSYSVTSQGIPGIDIRLMIETLRLKEGKYISRIATDKTKIKLDPQTGAFYNLDGRWQPNTSNTFDDYYVNNKENPNNILGYNITADSIEGIKELPNDFKSSPYSDDKENAQSYATLAAQIAAKEVPNVHVYEMTFNSKAWEGDYLSVMYAMLRLGGQDGKILYKNLKMTMEVWETGFIRSIKFTESYDIDLGSLKAVATLESNLQCSYKPKQVLVEGEKPVTWLRQFLNRFGKKFKNNRKVPADVDASKLK